MITEYIKYLYWQLKGRPIPAVGEIKRIILHSYAKKHNLKVFVETGTFNGDTVEAMRPYFKTLHSIELSKELYLKAKRRFAYYSNISIWNGDSGKVLKKILPNLKSATLFWLDAHGSGGITAEGEEWSPIIHELSLITKISNKKNVILIDDARGFTGNLSPTIQQIEEVISKTGRKYSFIVQDDIIRIIFL